MNNYYQTFELKNTTTAQIFDALTLGIQHWWTTLFEGNADTENETFTVRFGEQVFKTMRVHELIPNKKVVWLVIDSLIDIPELINQKEWINTSINWEITNDNANVQLHLTHVGLNPAIECYNICAQGWKQFTASLQSYLETGSGMPYIAAQK